jgi:hypothetical protein
VLTAIAPRHFWPHYGDLHYLFQVWHQRREEEEEDIRKPVIDVNLPPKLPVFHSVFGQAI